MPQDVIFPDTFCGGHRIVDSIPAAAMQQSVVPAGGAGQQLAAFKQRDLKSPQYQVVGQGRPGAATTDDNDVLHIYLLPYDSKSATINCHTFPRDGIWSPSLGEWGSLRSGPNDIMSIPS
jgi:hypothetical protein